MTAKNQNLQLLGPFFSFFLSNIWYRLVILLYTTSCCNNPFDMISSWIELINGHIIQISPYSMGRVPGFSADIYSSNPLIASSKSSTASIYLWLSFFCLSMSSSHSTCWYTNSLWPQGPLSHHVAVFWIICLPLMP